MKVKIFSSIILCCLLQATSYSQISFNNSNYLIPNNTFNSGVGLGISDMNNDGLSDIIHLDQGRNLFISYQIPGETFNTAQYQSMSNSSQWAMCAADIDNNGFPDVFSGGSYDGLKIAVANDQGNSYNIINMPGDDIFTQASNFVDIDNDGFVDLFSCHDDAKSKIYLNNGDGTFVESEIIDLTTTPVSDNSGNYGSVWTDFDNDGDIDLYIAKCRQGVSNSSDPRRINTLYVNDGSNNYTELAEEYGLKIGAQSWTADFGDMDNDGDLDCFITNHDVDSQILENDGTGHFTDITESTLINIEGLPIQGIWEDFDNDGFLDIIVAGSKHSIWRNNGDKTFTYVEAFDNNDMESFATGDLNSDGFMDVMGGYANIYTSPSDIDDVVWLNQGNSNNYLALNLTGVISNRNAIGAWIEIHGDWGIQIREVRAGESYGIMNDMKQIFGVGSSTNIDSLVIKWPSGIQTTLLDVEVNQTLNLIEQDCEIEAIDITSSSENLTLCNGESLELEGPGGYALYMWNNGTEFQSLTVTEPGMYFLQVEDDEGCIGISASIIVEGPEVLNPTISTMDDTEACEGSVINIILEGVEENYTWSNGSSDSEINVTENGVYFVSATNDCDDAFNSNEIEVSFIEVSAPLVEPDTIISPNSYLFESSEENTFWYENNPPIGEPIAFGQSFESPVLSEDVTYYAQSFISNNQEIVTGEMEQSGSNIFSGGVYNGSIIFNCYETFIINSVDVYAEILGDRIIQILDENGIVLHSKTITIEEEGWTSLDLSFEIQPGENLSMTTDQELNNELYGDNSPLFARNNQDVEYPYYIGEVGELIASNFGTPYYYYFYNWNVTVEKESCYSELVEVNGVYNPDTNTENLSSLSSIIIFPNPSKDKLMVQDLDLNSMDDIEIYDMYGRKQVLKLRKGILDIGHLSSGIYILELEQGNKRLKASFIKQ